ncbi:hypothetical protein GPECTOR_5g164 [Gonium pectorale]|uniref:Glycoside hydrolase family 42 N-terminal domain-containing protein n=1 Tax=Gonium pectorale TaxID=33097 RepID=A0A150GVZ2_GONPE|nr:hypothetical protein GPECTOR_5g164 [Gonium pectorale]|eukprot:KXZ54056.1 hypothetical protein GPECTOR_5g164 [Gonium pectorale]
MLPHMALRANWRSLRSENFKERFGSIFHSDLTERFKSTQNETQRLTGDLVNTLREMEATGISTAVFSSPWDWFEQEEGKIKYDYLDWVMQTTCQNTKLKVAFILDMVRAPAWVFTKFPDAKAMDSHYRQYQLLSWFHAEAHKVAQETLRNVVSHMANSYRECLSAVQPVYNNEYEAKYTQEHDCYQDYSPPAESAFREWLKVRRQRLEDLNGRWGTQFKTWEEVVPPVLEAGALMGVDMASRYWDFLKFREVVGAEVFTRSCAVVKSAGVRCFHHVPEFFSVLSAVYGASMFKHIAASPYVDFIIVNSNFRTSYGTVLNPTKLRMYINAAQSYGKPVYFEAAVERMSSLELLEAGFRHAAASGAMGIGLTNWLGRLPLNASLMQALHPAPVRCRATELVGVFIHLDSCSAWHGLQWGWSRKDPLHDFVQDLADTLGAECGTHMAVFMELDRFYNALPQMDRVVFVEPIMLFGAVELDLYALVKTAVRSMRHDILYMPVNQTNGVQMTVLQDL